MAKKKITDNDHSTEEKIKQAARNVFTKKGFSATRTRDIAEEANINLALLNYYFRSKEKLFDIVMMENMQKFLTGLKGVFNNENSSLIDKVSAVADDYINLLKANPDLPLFILSEIRANPDKLASNMGVKSMLHESHFFKQLKEATKGKLHPLHLMMNMMGMIVFPFVASPLLQNIGNLKQADFDSLMEERKKMVPLWFNAILKSL